MEVQIQKWGNSLAVRIPSAFARSSGIHPGSRVDLTEEKGLLVITPLVSEETSLELLLAGVTDDNLHHEVDTGNPVGSETW